MYDDIWRQIIEVHNHAKIVFLAAEEMDRNFKDYIQPNMELRNAEEHIIRAEAARLGLIEDIDDETNEAKFQFTNGNNENDGDYIRKSLDKALGHEYRAFFDAADWLSVRLREKIISLLHGYSHECISAVVPNYYTEISQRIDQICWGIAKIRGKKDISRKKIIKEVNEYRSAINELSDFHNRISHSIPTLIDWKKSANRSKLKNWLFCLLSGLLIALITFLLTYYCGAK